MINLTFAQSVQKRMKSMDASRRELQGISSDLLSASKRTIFAIHRGDDKRAKAELKEAHAKLMAGWRIVKKEKKLGQEGSWRAGQEEYSEAYLVTQYVTTGQISRIPDVADEPDIFLGAFSDFTGELVRRAVLLATEQKNRKFIEQIFRDVQACVEFLLEMDLTGNLRAKLDQAKQNLRKLEEIRYDIALQAQRQGLEKGL